MPKDRRGGLAYFYFDNKGSKKCDNPRASLVGCLCAQNAEFMNNEIQALSDKHTTDNKREMPLQTLLLSGLKYHDTMTILIDALDECSQQSCYPSVAIKLHGLIIRASSRKEADIARILEDLPHVELKCSNMTTDISLMLRSCIKRRQRDNAQFIAQADFQNQLIDALVDGARGKVSSQFALQHGWWLFT